MTRPPSERQVLYALVAAGWLIVVGVLAGVAAALEVSPTAWTVTFAVLWLAAVVESVRSWRRTGRLLSVALVAFVVWVAGTLLTR
ncbi:MAG: hypothetical protein R3246_00110 [Acidimicrobiia bacterium]|nr:hypothetical protein [Acidimicrobiia bacterium]